MGTQEQGIPHSSLELSFIHQPGFENFNRIFTDFQKKFKLSFLESGSLDSPRIYIFPIDSVPLLTDLSMDNLGEDLYYSALNGQCSLNVPEGSYRRYEEYLFQRFEIPNENRESSLTVVIYPSREYAERVQEADLLTFEESRTLIQKREKARERIQELRRDFPPIKVPINRLKTI